jgi:mono/diheme cytochrome c family protein
MDNNLPKYTVEVRPPRLGRLPVWAKYGLWISVAASWVPLSLIALGRYSVSSEPRIQLAQDMGSQPKYREQQSSEVFADGRADRQPIPGTVARGKSDDDAHYYRGYETELDPKTGLVKPATVVDPKTGKAEAKWFTTFPDQVKVTPALLHRGRERFNIYCTACHGYDGSGHGLVSDRGVELTDNGQARWVPAANLHGDQVLARPVGHIYNTINVGIRTMAPYGPQIPVEDRWAIVAYVRALQLSQNATKALVPADKQAELK